MRPHTGRRAALAHLAIVAIILTTMATSGQPASAAATSNVLYDRTHTPNLALHYVTRDGSDHYGLQVAAGKVRATAWSSNRGGPNGSNTRAAIWPPSTKMVTDQQSCAQWSDQTGAWSQQGIALRVRIDGNRFRMIGVLKNIVYGANWQLNVVTWDTARSKYLQVHGAVSLRAPFERNDMPVPLPWNVCARVQGRVVTIKGWRADESEPSWTDPGHTGRVTVPTGWVFAGKAGWYAGHLQARNTVGMIRLKTTSLD